MRISQKKKVISQLKHLRELLKNSTIEQSEKNFYDGLIHNILVDVSWMR